jgi:hypothetical protein
MTPPALGNGDAAARPGTGRTQIIHSGAARTARPTGQNSRHIGGSARGYQKGQECIMIEACDSHAHAASGMPSVISGGSVPQRELRS